MFRNLCSSNLAKISLAFVIALLMTFCYSHAISLDFLFVNFAISFKFGSPLIISIVIALFGLIVFIPMLYILAILSNVDATTYSKVKSKFYYYRYNVTKYIKNKFIKNLVIRC